jgi:hypothetical protein
MIGMIGTTPDRPVKRNVDSMKPNPFAGEAPERRTTWERPRHFLYSFI